MEPYTRPAREKAGQKYGSAFRLHHTGQLLYGDDSVRTLQEPLARFGGALVLVVPESRVRSRGRRSIINFLLKDGVYERREAIETFWCAEG